MSIPHVNLPILLHLILILVSLDVRPGRTKPVISNLEIPELVLGFPHLSSQHSDSQPIITTYRVQARVQSTEYRLHWLEYRVQPREFLGHPVVLPLLSRSLSALVMFSSNSLGLTQLQLVMDENHLEKSSSSGESTEQS